MKCTILEHRIKLSDKTILDVVNDCLESLGKPTITVEDLDDIRIFESDENLIVELLPKDNDVMKDRDWYFYKISYSKGKESFRFYIVRRFIGEIEKFPTSKLYDRKKKKRNKFLKWFRSE